MKEWLWAEWRRCNRPKYYKYFDVWYSNLTENQILFFTAFSEGRKTL